MSRSWEEIANIMVERRKARHPLIEKMMQVRERYNGDWVIPELGGDADPLIPTIIADAIDHNGLRAASVMPDIIAPALDDTKPTGRHSLQFASRRRSAWMYMWEKSELNLHMRRSMRHHFGYATSVLALVPDFDLEIPRLLVRDPLHAFPEPKAPEDLSLPANCGFLYGKSADWLRANYEKADEAIGRAQTNAGSDLWDIVEWIDEDDCVIGVLGPRWSDGGWHPTSGNMRPFELKRYPNRAGRCTVATPSRITLDKLLSPVSQVVSHVDLQARLLHLDIMATEKAIIPDTFIMGTSAMVPRLVGGTWKDGRTGEVNIVLDATQVAQLRGTPDPNNKITQDRIERNARTSAGLIPQFGGETYGNARTGRGVDALLAAAVDPRIQEAQEVMQASLTKLNEIAAHLWLGYWPDRKYTVFSGWTSARGMTKFEPGVEFAELKENKVQYALVGTDIMTLNIALGQLSASELMSKRTARALHPFIKDAEGEENRVLIEKLQAAVEMQLLTRASDPMGGMTPIDLAAIMDKVANGKPLAAAIEEANREAQERQAAAAPPPPDGGLAPEAMAGLANPGEGGEMQPPVAVPGPPRGLANLDGILGALSAPPVGQG